MQEHGTAAVRHARAGIVIDLDNEIIRVRESLEQTKLGVSFKLPKSKAGIRDITLPAIVVDVLNAQQQVFQTRRDLQQARYNYLLSTLRLKASAGTLTEKDVEDVNRTLGNS